MQLILLKHQNCSFIFNHTTPLQFMLTFCHAYKKSTCSQTKVLRPECPLQYFFPLVPLIRFSWPSAFTWQTYSMWMRFSPQHESKMFACLPGPNGSPETVECAAV